LVRDPHERSLALRIAPRLIASALVCGSASRGNSALSANALGAPNV
jgi:hypothetical protein